MSRPKGVEWDKRMLPEIEGVCSFGTQKISMRSAFDVSLMKGSRKYGNQIQLCVFSPTAKVEDRSVMSAWNRIELFIPASNENIDKLIAALESLKMKQDEEVEQNA